VGGQGVGAVTAQERLSVGALIFAGCAVSLAFCINAIDEAAVLYFVFVASGERNAAR